MASGRTVLLTSTEQKKSKEFNRRRRGRAGFPSAYPSNRTTLSDALGARRPEPDGYIDGNAITAGIPWQRRGEVGGEAILVLVWHC